MSGSSSISAPLPLFRQAESRWIAGLFKLAGAGLLLLLCGFYIAPEVSRIQTGFYLTLLPAALLLLCWRRDFSFLFSWQFLSFLALPALLALSSLWATPEQADVERDPGFYLKLVVYLGLFYSALYMVLERRGTALLESWLRWLIAIGLVSCIASLVQYGLDGGFARLHRIGGISLEGDIDKTGLLYGFHTLFCCYGLTLDSRRWRLISWTGLLTSCVYIVVSQTKIPIVIAGVSILLATLATGPRLAKIALLCGLLLAVPLGYLLIFGDLPLLHRGNAYSIRLDLWGKTFDQFLQSPLIGSGLVHKLYLELDRTLPHPHNYLLDVARFCGLLGVAACLWQLGAAACAVLSQEKLFNWVPGIYALWFGFGVLAMLIYAQQPLVKPSYIWFLYWVPLAILLVHSQLRAAATEETDGRGGAEPADINFTNAGTPG